MNIFCVFFSSWFSKNPPPLWSRLKYQLFDATLFGTDNNILLRINCNVTLYLAPSSGKIKSNSNPKPANDIPISLAALCVFLLVNQS